jgi:hypothetical protein
MNKLINFYTVTPFNRSMKSIIEKNSLLLIVLHFCISFFGVLHSSSLAWSALQQSVRGAERARSSQDDLKHQYEVSFDLAAVYTRETDKGGATSPGAKFNLGGQFANWIGLDLTGLMQTRSRSYFLGSTLRLMPMQWLFVKAGGGMYNDKATNSMNFTPLVGAGIKAHFSEYYYMLAEGTAFQSGEQKRNIGFSMGLGIIF